MDRQEVEIGAPELTTEELDVVAGGRNLSVYQTFMLGAVKGFIEAGGTPTIVWN
jgi:hypothetical protein